MANLSRRSLLKAGLAGAGALIGTRLAGPGLMGIARAAAPKPTTLVVVYFNGGLNAIFTGADAFLNRPNGPNFGVTNGNMTQLGGSNLFIDNTMRDAIPMALRGNVASVGIRHGTSDHGNAQQSLFMSGTQSAPLMLADAIGGTGAIKAAVVGGDRLPNDVMPNPVNGVSLQPVRDMQATIETIVGAEAAPNKADRPGSAKGIRRAGSMSKTAIAKSPVSLQSVDQGVQAAVTTLEKPIPPFDQAEFNTAWDLNGTNINSFKSKMAAAELMVRGGANFVLAQDGGWDTHGDSDGNNVRNMVSDRIAPGINLFLQRMLTGPGADERNVMLAVVGDFHRSLNGSDHASAVSALVVGPNIKNGSTGRTDANVGMAAGTPAIAGFWQFMGAASRLSANPFGANPHANLLR